MSTHSCVPIVMGIGALGGPLEMCLQVSFEIRSNWVCSEGAVNVTVQNIIYLLVYLQ